MIKLWCIHIYTYICIHTYTYVHTYTCLHVFIYACVWVCSVAQLCLTLQSHDRSSPGSSVHGISQARILSGLPFYPPGSSKPRDSTQFFCIGRWILYHWATWEAHMYVYIDIHTHIYMHTHTHTYTYNGVLLNPKKERNNVICSNMDGRRNYHTEWSKSDKE